MSEEKIISEVTQELNNEEQTTNYEYADVPTYCAPAIFSFPGAFYR